MFSIFPQTRISGQKRRAPLILCYKDENGGECMITMGSRDVARACRGLHGVICAGVKGVILERVYSADMWDPDRRCISRGYFEGGDPLVPSTHTSIDREFPDLLPSAKFTR
jgi:hypothetical protein